MDTPWKDRIYICIWFLHRHWSW